MKCLIYKAVRTCSYSVRFYKHTVLFYQLCQNFAINIVSYVISFENDTNQVDHASAGKIALFEKWRYF